MTFASSIYFLFLPIVFGLTFTIAPRFRVHFLLAASYAFYMYWKPAYLLIIIAMTLTDYLSALAIERSEGRRRRGFWILSVGANLSILAVFKYLGFFAHEFHFRFPDLLLPIGLSFHTLQAISYTTDVYRGVLPAEKNLARFALFIAWFPQMVAGPVERGSSLIPQFSKIDLPVGADIHDALGLILWGLFKKIVVADNLAIFVDSVYASPQSASPWAVVLSVYLFALQLYFDFSGYTDIARGSSALFSVRLSRNFDRPFASATVIEFWKRWHISLSTWFFEYVYYPLARYFPSVPGLMFAGFCVFVLSGLWHGANWTFIVWGAVHGFAFCLALVFRVRSVFLTFNLVAWLWVIFRAPSLKEAWVLLGRLTDWGALTFSLGPVATLNLALAVAAALLALVGEKCVFKDDKLEGTLRDFSPAIAAGILLVILSLGAFSGERFIYFQF